MSRPEPSSTSQALVTTPSTSLQRSSHASADELDRAHSPGSGEKRSAPVELVVRFADGQEYVIVPDQQDLEWRLDIESPLPPHPFGVSSAAKFVKEPLQQHFVLSISGRIASAVVGYTRGAADTIRELMDGR